MFTDVQILNLGLSKIASSRVNRIDPATTPLERFMAVNYPHWRRTELTKRRWAFAMEANYTLTLNETLTGVSKPYKYVLPIDCLRPIRTKTTEWVQRGRYIYSSYSTLKIDYIKNVPESDDDPLFDEVLACRIAFESAEYVTQSSTKKEAAREDYKEALAVAASANAFTIGPEDIQADDNDFSWVQGRLGNPSDSWC